MPPTLTIDTTLFELCEVLQVQLAVELDDELAAVAAEAVLLDMATDPNSVLSLPEIEV